MRVLGHLAALICVKEDVVNIERSSNKGLLVCSCDRLGSGCSDKASDGPEALAKRADVKVDLDLVILYESLIPPLSGYLSAFSQ